MDLVVYIFRNSCREGIASVSKELGVAKEHLRYIFSRDPVETRRTVCHAAAITGIARECTIYTPCETMRVFMGFAFLLAFTKYFPFQLHNSNSALNHRTTIKLDSLPWDRSPSEISDIENWVEVGGNASLESVGNICDIQNFEPLKQTALDRLQDLHVWGLAGKFYRTIRNFY